MRGNKRIGLWLLLPVLALLLAACGNNSNATPTPTTAPAITPTSESAAVPATSTPVVFNAANTLPLDQAIPYYEQAAKLQPQNPDTLYYLAEAYFETKQYDKAEVAYKDVIKIAPNEAILHGQLGLVLFKLEKYDEAEAEYKQVIKLNPQSPATFNNLAYLYVELGRFDEARDPIDKAEKLGMGGDENFEATKLGLLIPDGLKEETAGNLDKAAELYAKAAKAENSLGYYYLGKLEQGRKKIDAATAAFKSYLAEGHVADLKKDVDARLKQMGKA